METKKIVGSIILDLPTPALGLCKSGMSFTNTSITKRKKKPCVIHHVTASFVGEQAEKSHSYLTRSLSLFSS